MYYVHNIFSFKIHFCNFILAKFLYNIDNNYTNIILHIYGCFTYRRYQTKYDGGLAQLIVDNAQSGDSGEYTCVASNGRDRISTTGFLTVYTSPSVFRKPLLQPSLSVDGIESGRRLYSQTSHDFRFSVNDKFDFGCQKFGGDLTIRRPEYPKFVSSIIADDVATYGGTIALQVRVQGQYWSLYKIKYIYNTWNMTIS